VKGVTLAEFSEFLASQGFPNVVEGDGQVRIAAVNTLDEAGDGDISFLSNPKYTELLSTTKASAVIVGRSVSTPTGPAVMRCDDPYAAVTAAIVRIHGYRSHPSWGIDARACVSADARVGPNANVGPWATIAPGATIGANATLYPGCYVGDGARIGDDVTLFPNVVIYDGAVIGNRVTIHAGSVIGQDGLGYAPRDGRWIKIPQVGRIVIEDDVEIGANCSFDRATLGRTRVGRGTKFSNNVVIGHGAHIGEDCMIVALVGIAGSARIGNHVTLAGQVGVAGHLEIADHVKVGAKSGVASSIKHAGDYMGTPAVEAAAFRRQVSVVHRLPEMKGRLRALEQQVAELRRKLDEAAGR